MEENKKKRDLDSEDEKTKVESEGSKSSSHPGRNNGYKAAGRNGKNMRVRS